MELYELRAKTLNLLISLRKYGTIGPESYLRSNGKSTALLMYAKELLDNQKTVWFACHDPKFYQRMFRGLFPHAVSEPGFIKAAPRGLTAGSYLLIDEPHLLKWDESERRNVGTRAKVVSVGPA